MALIKGGSRRSARGPSRRPFQFPAGTVINGKSVGGRFASAAQAEIFLKAEDDPAALAEAGIELEGRLRAGLQAIAELAVQKARSKAPVRTGALRNSITGRVNGDTITISATAAHARWQEEGRGPMNFNLPTSGGKSFYRFTGPYDFEPGEAHEPFVHPGYAAQNYMSDTLDEIADEAGEILAIMFS
jgi:hypothetical protein